MLEIQQLLSWGNTKISKNKCELKFSQLQNWVWDFSMKSTTAKTKKKKKKEIPMTLSIIYVMTKTKLKTNSFLHFFGKIILIHTHNKTQNIQRKGISFKRHGF